MLQPSLHAQPQASLDAYCTAAWRRTSLDWEWMCNFLSWNRMHVERWSTSLVFIDIQHGIFNFSNLHVFSYTSVKFITSKGECLRAVGACLSLFLPSMSTEIKLEECWNFVLILASLNATVCWRHRWRTPVEQKPCIETSQSVDSGACLMVDRFITLGFCVRTVWMSWSIAQK